MKQLKFSKSTTLGVVIAGASLIAAGSAFAAPTTTPMASIADSWHNLGTGNIKGITPNGGAPANASSATAEVCVFCHTPHGGDNNAAVPLWNRVLSAPTIYKRYSSLGTSTFDAQEAEIGSVTIACLSCHDGTNAIDSVINAPGSGGYNAGGARFGTMVGADVNANGQLAADVVQNLGTDLSNDHPVSMQYAGGGVVGNTLGPTNDIDFIASGNPKVHAVYQLQSSAVTVPNSAIAQLWWIERGADSLTAAARDREDIILYSRTDPNVGNVEQPFVECGSCHDPHNVDNPTFLRVSNGVNTDSVDGFPVANGGPSELCLSCHIK